MKLFAPLAAATALVAAIAAQPAFAAGSVSIEIGQPGMYGRIIIGDDRPTVVYHEPIIVAPARYAPVRQPIYLYVPPGHQKNWKKHCHLYQACGQPVYFVEENWVRDRHAKHRSPRVEQRHAQPQRQVRHDDRRRAEPPRQARHDDRRDDRRDGRGDQRR